jgi:hypothetical protein
MTDTPARYWHRQPAIDKALGQQFAESLQAGKFVVDVGAGYDPWPYATQLVDLGGWEALQSRGFTKVDIERERLPYGDKAVDFAYCRHTLEDLHWPDLACSEMNRTAKAGYIETPSPLAEFCRGVDGTTINYRGYSHHRWFVWSENGTLIFLPKYPVAEFAQCDIEQALTERLYTTPCLWNSYHPWTGALSHRILRHPQDFDIRTNYAQSIMHGINCGIANATAFIRDFGLEGTQFIGAPVDRSGQHQQRK